LTPKAATTLLAGYIADGDLLDKVLHAIAKDILEDHPDAGQFLKMDAEKSHGIKFHTISIPIPQEADNRQAVVGMIGESLEIVIGVGKEHGYLAAGRDALPALKKAIAVSSAAGATPVRPVEVSLAFRPIANLTAEIGKPQDRSKGAMANEELKKTPGKDHVLLTVRPISNGVQAHLEVEQGLLRVIGRLATGGAGN
jgi:hypothetical protein